MTASEPTAQEDFLEGGLGFHPRDLAGMKDIELATWQAKDAEGVKQILADREWQRRMISHQLTEQFSLDARLAAGMERAMRFAAIIGVVGTLAGAGVGTFATFKTGSAQTFLPATQSHTQAAPEPSIMQSTPAKAPVLSASK